MALIEVTGATKRYGKTTALDNVSLRVDAGDCLALVGESGSGKTTLLRTINRLTVLDEGQVLVRGEDVDSADPVRLRRSIGYVQQDGGLIPHWTCAANASLVAQLLHLEKPQAIGRAALAAVGLEPDIFADRYPRDLSGGQRQRVAIARALAAGPDILLMDEPFGALDALTRFDVQEAFVRLRELSDVTALIVTHDLREALRIGTHVAVMRDGKVVEVTPASRFAAQATGYAKELLTKSGLTRATDQSATPDAGPPVGAEA